MGFFGFFKKKKEQPSAFKERRAVPRWQIQSNARLKWEGQAAFVDCQVHNINLKGFAFTLAQKLPEPCTAVILNFHERFIFNVEIAVAWHREAEGRHQYGAAFTRIRDEDREKMYLMIRQDFPRQLQGSL